MKDNEGQKTLINTVVSVYNNNSTRCIQVLEKLWQMGIVGTENLINYALSTVEFEDSISHKILTHFVKRALDLRYFLVTLHRQKGFLPSLINP